MPNLSKSVENSLSYKPQKTKQLFKSKQDGLCFVISVPIWYARKPNSFNPDMYGVFWLHNMHGGGGTKAQPPSLTLAFDLQQA